MTRSQKRKLKKSGSYDPDQNEIIRRDYKFFLETAKPVCNFINMQEEHIKISTFGENRVVIRIVSKVIKEANNRERKRRQTVKKRR